METLPNACQITAWTSVVTVETARKFCGLQRFNDDAPTRRGAQPGSATAFQRIAFPRAAGRPAVPARDLARVVVRRDTSCDGALAMARLRRPGRSRGARLGICASAAEKMGVARIAPAGLARQVGRRTARPGVWRAFERAFDFGHVAHLRHAAGAAAQLAGRLRSAQQQLAQDRGLLGENSSEPKPVLQKRCWYFGTRLPKPERSMHQVLRRERVEGLLHRALVELEDGIAIALLVAGVGQCVERQRVLIGRGDRLLDQAADDARFDG